MKITCISDTHTAEIELGSGDVLVHAGDLTYRGRTKETKRQLDWLASYKDKFKEIIIVPGNHEVDWQSGHVPFQRYCAERGLTVLVDQSKIIDGVKFYGTPTTPEFCGWAYMKLPGEIGAYWDNIPDDTDVLITHGPPHGILDANPHDYKCGCPQLLTRVKVVKPSIHIFGHIHDGHGMVEKDGTVFINAAIMDEDYQPTNNPIKVQL